MATKVIRSLFSHDWVQKVTGVLVMGIAAAGLSALFHTFAMKAVDDRLKEYDESQSAYAKERDMVLKALSDRTSGRWTVEMETLAWEYYREHGEIPPIGKIHAENWREPYFVKELLESVESNE